MDVLTLTPATEFPYGRLARLLNHAYSDYYVSVWLNPEQFEQMCTDMDVDLKHSVVATVDQREVGLAFLSIRGSEGWISGVGVVPARRRQGIGRRMVHCLQRYAVEARLERVRLEVLEQNRPAITLYEALGFRRERDLLVLVTESKGTRDSSRAEDTLPSLDDWEIAAAPPRWLLRFHEDFHEMDPSWQRDRPSLQSRASRLDGLSLWAANRVIGYCLYAPQSDVISIMDLAVDPNYRHGERAAYHLLRTVHSTWPDLGGQIANLPAQDPVLSAFVEFGYQVWQRQYEMAWHTSDGV